MVVSPRSCHDGGKRSMAYYGPCNCRHVKVYQYVTKLSHIFWEQRNLKTEDSKM